MDPFGGILDHVSSQLYVFFFSYAANEASVVNQLESWKVTMALNTNTIRVKMPIKIGILLEEISLVQNG